MKLLDMLEKKISGDNFTTIASKNPSNVGLTTKEASYRLEADGKNQLESKKRISPFCIFLSQYKDIMTLILLCCTAVSLFMGEYVEAIAIAVIVLMNGILGFIQEFKTERTLEALRGMASPQAKVMRDGVITQIPATELVRGDVILIEAGDRIPADCILLEATSLACDEAMLTGESLPAKKLAATDEAKSENKAYMGCVVTKGHGKCKIVATGMKTEMGAIASMLQTIEDDTTPLQKRLAQLSKYIAIGCLLICLVVSVTGVLRGEPILQMLITGVSLAVAAVPEGLPAIVTISLALSVSRMVKRNALVRRLHAVETLGCATVICSDKTGTITQNKMSVTTVAVSDKMLSAAKLNKNSVDVNQLFQAITLCNNAILGEGISRDFGEHTELALLRFAHSYGYSKIGVAEKFKRIHEQPFDSERKRMSVGVIDVFNQKTLYVKGGFDVLLPRCTGYLENGEVHPMKQSDIVRFTSQNEEMADAALRVIGVAYRPISSLSPSFSEDNLIYIGQIGMMDPPRKEVKEAVARCRRAGIRTVMITGDHKKTAVAVAKLVGIYREGDLALTGEELDKLTAPQLAKAVSKVTVYARVSPSHKLQIVRALKQTGHVAAMTGDGVNDAPAIKEADIGVSMGMNGSDVTKEASEIILLDDNFATLVNAVDEGRSIYNNIRKFIRYLLACNIGEVLTMFLGMIMGMPVILLPIQILLINLVTDGLPAIALGLEPSDSDAMSRPPRKQSDGVFSGGLAGKIVIRGIFIGLSTLFSFVTLFRMSGDIDISRSGALFALIIAQLIHVFECKSEDKNLLHINYFNNKKLLTAVAFSLAILLAVLYVPVLNIIFSTVPLSPSQLLVPIAFSMAAPLLSIIFWGKGNSKH